MTNFKVGDDVIVTAKVSVIPKHSQNIRLILPDKQSLVIDSSHVSKAPVETKAISGTPENKAIIKAPATK